MSKEQSQALTETMSNLLAKQPFFATLLYRLVGGVTESDEVPTAATDGQRIIVNPEWFGNLKQKERLFVLAHEIMHVVLDHMHRGKMYSHRGFGPDLKEWSHSRWNKACDYIINDLLSNSGVGMMPHGGLHHPNYGENDIADEVYPHIPEDDDENFDIHLEPDSSQPAKTQDEIKGALISAAGAAKQMGTLPAGIERLVGELVNPKIPWNEKLRNMMMATTGHDAQTWARANRRRIATAPHIYMPGTTGYETGPVAVVIDTSGSVSEKELTAFLTETAGILSDCRPEVTYVMWTDAEVAHVDELQTDEAEEVEYLKPHGGGGTDMTAAFRYIDKEGMKVDTCIVLTDGYTPFGEQTPYETIWVSTSDQASPWGETIHLDLSETS